MAGDAPQLQDGFPEIATLLFNPLSWNRHTSKEQKSRW